MNDNKPLCISEQPISTILVAKNGDFGNKKQQISHAKSNASLIPKGSRAALLTRNDDGSDRIQPVPPDASVLNIERDLREHMNQRHYSDAWMIQLRDYIDQRLMARKEARAAGGCSAPADGGARWSMGEFQQVEVVEVL